MILNPKLFILPYNEIKSIGETNLTYGSLTNKGCSTMGNIIKKYRSNIYGLDLGCGDGELIYNLQQIIPNSIWEGVEISEHRISLQTRDVAIWQGDILDENFKSYNVLHADNLCLDDLTSDKLEEKISNEFNGIYITYRTPKNIQFLKKSIFLESVLTETTWGNHLIHYYLI
jgi:trans-aconitate methyltransferase